MRTGRPMAVLMLTDGERESLERWGRRPKTGQALAQRARIVLACASGKTNMVVAEQIRVSKQCVGTWRSRVVRKRLDGSLDEPRPGSPRLIRDAKVGRTGT